MASHNATAPAGRKSLFSLVRTKINKFFQDFWEFLKSVLSLFRLDFCEAMLFILFCTIFTAFATSILKKLLFGAMMWVSGETYIAPANAKHVFFHPVSIVLMIIFAVIITLFSLFEIAGLLHTFSVAKAGYETNLTCMFLAGFRACRKALNPRNWPLILFVLVLFPLTKVLPLSSSTFKLILPSDDRLHQMAESSLQRRLSDAYHFPDRLCFLDQQFYPAEGVIF